MNRRLLFVFSFALVLFFGIGCAEEEEPEVNINEGRAFYPIDTVIERIFEVDSIIYDLVGGQQVTDTVRGLLRFRMVPEQGSMELSHRPDTSGDWQVQRHIDVVAQDDGVYEWDKGIVLQKLEFPIFEGASWEETITVAKDRTIRIRGEEIMPFSAIWDTRVYEIADREEIAGYSLGRLMKKTLVDEDFLIELRQGEEWYAEGVGMVYKHLRILDTQCEHLAGEFEDCVEIPWHRKANKGFEVEMRLKEIR